jgi:hypothetical protein
MCSFLVITALIAFNCSDNSTGPGSPTVSSSVIDISHNGTGGFTFGLHGADQLKRFQTFIADSTCLNITGIDVKIRRNVSSVAYDNVTVELYETAGNLPTNLLAVSSINIDSLGMNFTVLNAPLKYSSLTAGHTYAIVLGQSNVMAINNGGFEWCTSNVDTNLNFGKYNGTGWVSEPSLGDGWLKVYVDKIVRTNEYAFPAGTQVVFFDDFQRNTVSLGNGWLDLQYGGGPVDSLRCKIVNEGNGNKVFSAIQNGTIGNGDTNWVDYTLSAKVKFVSSGTPIAVQFRRKDDNNAYEITINGGVLYLSKYVSGWTDLANDTISSTLNQWYNLKISVSGNRILVYWDNSIIPNIDVTDVSDIPKGAIDFLFWASSHPNGVFVDDILATVP